nr:hypothetical protein [Tanacetum cinerariifolium]
EDITDPTTAMNMALSLMAKEFKLNYSTPTNNNQRISPNPRNRQIAQPGMNVGQDRQMQMIGGNDGNQFRQYAGQNARNMNGYNAVQNVENQVAKNPRVQNVRNQNGLIDGSAEVHENYDDNEIFNMFTQEEQYSELLEPISKPQQVPQNDNNVISEGEGSSTPSKPHHTPFPEVETSHPTTLSIPLPSIPTVPIPPVTQPVTTPIIQYSRRARIAQSSALPTIADELASPVRDVSEGEACPTESGFIADQDRETIVKSSTLPHDPAPKVTSPTADEGNMQHNISELTALCTSLQRQYSELQAKFQAQEDEIVKLKDRVKVLEDRKEEIARVLTSMDAATVLAGGIDVPTGSGFIPAVGPPTTVISTGSENFMHAPVEWKLYDLSEVHHLTAKDKEIFMLVEKDYPLRKGLALVMISYKLQVENYSQMAEDLIRKIYNITNTPRQ